MSETAFKTSDQVQGLMVFLSSLSHGLEHVLGRGAATITFRAGRTIGLREKSDQATEDIVEALRIVDQRLQSTGVHWPFEIFQPSTQPGISFERDGKRVLKLVFRHCMVRCALFRYSHEQKQSLCMMNHGMFCGYLQNVLGKRAELLIVHAGQSACLKELVITE